MTPNDCSEYGCKCQTMTRRDMIQDIAFYALTIAIVALAALAAIFGFLKQEKQPVKPEIQKTPIGKVRYKV